MDDQQFLAWLMFVTRELSRRSSPASNAGPRYWDKDTFVVDDEAFLRWMGWRGEEAQERECSWAAEDLKQERLDRSYRKVWKENQELKSLLRFIHAEIGKKIGT